MIDFLLSLIGVCRHRNMSRPFTHRGTKCSHVICMDCAQSFSYDVSRMQIGARLKEAN